MTDSSADRSGGDREAVLATEELDSADLALLQELRRYFEASDPLPDGLVDRIKFELTLDALHAEVATLTQLDLAPSGARGTTTEAVRSITFTSESLTTMVTLTPQPGGTVRVDGWAAPGPGIRIEILLADGPLETYTDDDGRFVFEQVPTGLAKFALYLTAEGSTSTVLSPAIEL